LTFSSPSHLVILEDLPPRLPNFTAIPDSVKSLVFRVDEKADCGYTLMFGPDSQFERVQVWPFCPSRRQHLLLVLPSDRLKYFRSRLEFSTSDIWRP
jgi:hypothetical protein